MEDEARSVACQLKNRPATPNIAVRRCHVRQVLGREIARIIKIERPISSSAAPLYKTVAWPIIAVQVIGYKAAVRNSSTGPQVDDLPSDAHWRFVRQQQSDDRGCAAVYGFGLGTHVGQQKERTILSARIVCAGMASLDASRPPPGPALESALASGSGGHGVSGRARECRNGG